MRAIAAFPYLQVIHPVVGRVFEPVVEVTLRFGENRVHHLLFLDSVPALLGRLDVFDHYTFEFNHDRRMVVVKS